MIHFEGELPTEELVIRDKIKTLLCKYSNNHPSNNMDINVNANINKNVHQHNTIQLPKVFNNLVNIKQEINEAYEGTVHWKKNLFTLPSGKIGKMFVAEIIELVNAWREETEWGDYSLKALHIMPNILLQKTTNTKNIKYTNKLSKENPKR